ncbi:MAG: PLP-dependent aminotransferase family protein [Gammaproteobacteria bacterium]|nr:PLP-dependent aminotransferase family protein [Gammaproteobacteria bacterium]
MWHPELPNSTQPRYLALADALAQAIQEGSLTPGVRLPTHRDLAERLGVTVGTVSRAYSEAERRGLIRGEVGRGTFVRKPTDTVSFGYHATGNDVIDLSLNRPTVGQQHAEALRQAQNAILEQARCAELLTYQAAEGLPAHREAGAQWMRQNGVDARADRVLVTSGGQHALYVALAALTKPGDIVLTEKLTYPGIKSIACQLHLSLRGLDMDAQGIVPESLRNACRDSARLLVCVPTLQNPTTATMSLERRREIAEIAIEHDIRIIEDDVYGCLVENRPPPLVTLIPERTCYLNSISKCLFPGLRVGYLLVPEDNLERYGAIIRTTMWMVAPLMAEVATLWIRDGTADRFAQWQREAARNGQAIAARIMGRWDYRAEPTGLHFWLTLPSPWLAGDFVQQAKARGILTTPASSFAVERSGIPHAVRVCVTATDDARQLEKGLNILAELLDEAPRPGMTTI